MTLPDHQAAGTDQAMAGAGAAQPPGKLSLPMLIDGRRLRTGSDQVVASGPAAKVTMPAFTAEALGKINSLDRHLLADLPLHDIVSFINRVGRNWRSDEYSRRRLYIRQLQSVLGYSPEAAEHEADMIGVILTSHTRMMDAVGVELGHRYVIDEWVRTEEAFVRAYPVGLVVHILPGNVPSSNVLSLVRALVTKNISLLKPASGDPVTPVSLALSFQEVDPAHPVARAVNVAYWPEADPLGAQLVRGADAVCAWGSAPAIAWAKENTSAETPFIPFGPKRSIALIGADADLTSAAEGLAHDVSVYDQAACFSVQRVFLAAPVEPFIAELQRALDHYEDLLPPQRLDEHDHAALNAQRLDLVFSGADEHKAGARAAIMVAPADVTLPSPLRRTIILHPVDDLSVAYDHVDPGVQTVAAAPWELLAGHRDALVRRGVCRFVELGLSNIFRVGGAHDGQRPLSRMVRFAAQEAPSAEIPKGMVLPLNLTRILENRSFQDVVF